MPKKPESSGELAASSTNRAHILGFLLKSLQHTLRQTFDETLRKQGVELSFAQFAALFNLHCRPRRHRARGSRAARWYRRKR